jgi:hypothetical protein
MKLIVTGTMGLSDQASNGNRNIYIHYNISSGKICNLDFTDCDIPTIAFNDSNSAFLWLEGIGVKVNITGLKLNISNINSNGRVILLINVSNSSFDNITINAGGQDSIFFYAVNNSNNNYFNNCRTVNGIAMNFSNSKNNIVSNCNFTMCYSGINTVGDCPGIIIAQCNIMALTNCIACNQNTNNIKIINSSFRTIAPENTIVISISGQDVGNIQINNCIIINDSISDSYGIYATSNFSNLTNISITNCSISAYTNDVIIYAPAVNLFISGNLFSKNGLAIGGVLSSYLPLSNNIYFPQYANKFNQIITI